MPKTSPGETRERIYSFVRDNILSGQSPSLSEVQEAFGFKVKASAREHLLKLVEMGRLTHAPGQDRGYGLPDQINLAMIPLLGQVHAGTLVEAIEAPDGYEPVKTEDAEGTFALTVVGESMQGADIHDGDVVLVNQNARIKNGDIVVSMLDGEANIKTFFKRNGRVVLHAENLDFSDITIGPDCGDFQILGRVFEIRKRR
jgi:repressor LexA